MDLKRQAESFVVDSRQIVANSTRLPLFEKYQFFSPGSSLPPQALLGNGGVLTLVQLFS